MEEKKTSEIDIIKLNQKKPLLSITDKGIQYLN